MPRKHATKSARGNRNDDRPALSPETRHSILVVALFACGAIGVLAFAGGAGRAGIVIADALRAVFGLAAYLVPLVLLILASLLVREDRPTYSAWQLIGLSLAAASITGLLHLRLDAHAATAPMVAMGGGYLGFALAIPLVSLFGSIATGVLLVCGMLIGCFLGFHLSFDHLRTALRAVMNSIRSVRLAFLAFRYRTPQSATDTNGPMAATFTERPMDVETADDASEAADRTSPAAPASTASEEDEEDATPSNAAPAADALAAPARKRPRRPRVEIPLTLLSNEIGKPMSGDVRAAQEIIRRTLEQFRITVEMGDIRVGPTVTQYTLRPSEGVKLSRITALQNDLALALAAHPIRIEAPIPGKSLVGVEVPNQRVAVVRLREIFESEVFQKRSSNLTVALGKDVAGAVWTADISRMPHCLVAGSTGSGKSVMLNAIIVSLLMQNGPDDLRLLLVDPKRVEFPVYNGIPHLLTPVITDVKKTVQALKWALAEMDRRFELLAGAKKRDLGSYNATRRDDADRLPYLVIIIDELADLMAVAANEVEASIIRLAQMARAVGIHLIVATQRPSVDVITGLIKANITARIAFAVASSIDSRTILDQVGADRLLGRGDMLFTSAELSKPKRLQGAFVADQEIQRIVEHLREHSISVDQSDALEDSPIVVFTEREDSGDDDDHDELLPEAKEVLLQAGKGSASLLQRRLKVGYARAARILDILERQGFIGPADGAKPREVLGGRGESAPRTVPPRTAASPAEDDPIDDADESPVA
ncbi:DNA translocase FtsK 4TM domain-containing protein [Candidatus Uhrbacteria bacterium]|nr:DNA translocase FtsK 4TM domain-containing protein [Candidatus Uhrbacteria bacterium]